MKIKKRTVSFLLAVVLVICMIPATGHTVIAGPNEPPGLTRPPRPRASQVHSVTNAEDSCINCSDPSSPLCTTCLYYLDDVRP